MLLECIPHFDELYIRSYPLKAKPNPYGNKLIDLPVTLQVDEHSFYMTYRRDLTGGWKVMCADGQLRVLRARLCRMLACGLADEELNQTLATVFAYVEESCKEAMTAMPQAPTRRDVLENLVKERSAVSLLRVDVGATGRSLQFLYFGGTQVVAVELDLGPPEVLMDAMELDLDAWRALCDRIKACGDQPRQAIEAMIVRQFKQQAEEPSSDQAMCVNLQQLEVQA